MHQFIAYLIYVSVAARALGWSQDSAPIQAPVWVLLGIFGIFLFTEQALSRQLSWYPRLYTLVQAGLVAAMLYSDPTVDIFPMLFFPLSYQAVTFFRWRVGFSCIAVFCLLMCGMFLFGLEIQAGVTMVLAGSVVNGLMGGYAHLITRTGQKRMENQAAFKDLQEAYRKLKESAAQAEMLAAATERHRLVRELHDSLTQTLFSMNLAAQSAQLSLAEDPGQAVGHLNHLQELARSAAGEVQALTGQTPLRSIPQGGLAEAIRSLAGERLAQDTLQVMVEVTGERTLSAAVETNLYRITQEALNNITRHAGVKKALIRLRLESPIASLEVSDEGCGFDMEDSRQLKGFGLAGMAERAAEIGWELEIRSHPGEGTQIRVMEKAA